MRALLFAVIAFIVYPASAVTTTAAVGEYSVEYEMSGEGEVTILLEAGGSAGLTDWDSIFKQLTKHARVLRYSRVGNGNSTKVEKNYSAEQYAAEARELLAALKVDGKVVYIAHSYGAHVARVFAVTYPEQVAALMLIEPASEHDVDIMRQIDLNRAEQEIAQIKLDDMKDGLSNQYLDFWSKRPLPDYPQISDIPVTVIASVKQYKDPSILFFTDQARAQWGKLHSEWASTFPQGKAVLTNKSYHYPQFDEPEMVLTEIRELIGRVKL